MPAGQVSELLAELSLLTYSQIKTLSYSTKIVQVFRALALSTLGKCPCLWQVRAALAVLKGKKDVICVARTGAGKSMTFYLPLVIRREGVVIIIVPLNALATEMASRLSALGLAAIALVGNAVNEQNFKDITKLRYRVILTNPEGVLEKNGRFLKLLKDRSFLNNLITVIIDEVHCVVNWGDFRPQYKELGLLRFNLPETIPLYIASATLPPVLMRDVRRLLRLRSEPYEEIMSNDRPNVSIVVREIAHPYNSFWDLSFLVPLGWTPDLPEVARPLLFLVFFDSINVLQQALEFLRSRLPIEHRRMILPFHSEMSEEHRLKTLSLMSAGKVLGICASEGFGLGIDVPSVQLVVQWRTSRLDFCTLVQRFGRAARDPNVDGIGLLLIEPDLELDEEEEDILDGRLGKKRRKRRTGRGRAKRTKPTQPSRVSQGSQGPSVGIGVSQNPDAMEVDGEDEDDTSQVPGGDTTVQAIDLGDLWEEYFAWSDQSKNSTKTRNSPGIEPALRDLIRGRGNCRRTPWKVFFSKNKELASTILNSDIPTSHCRQPENGPCFHCQLPPPKFCCDIHSPSILDLLPTVKPVEFSTKPRRSRIMGKTNSPGTRGEDLALALEGWRERAALKWLGKRHQGIHGGPAVMSDQVIMDIVKYAAVGKIDSIDALRRETHWSRASKYGAQILAIIAIHSPPPPPPLVRLAPPPLGDSTVQFINMGNHSFQSNGHSQEPPIEPPELVSAYASQASGSKYAKKGTNKCSLCGSSEHINFDLTTPESKRCPLYEAQANKENS